MNFLWYLATPYTRYDKGIEEAFREACRCTATLMRRGECIFSPIAHTHPIAIHGNIDPVDHSFWMKADQVFMDECDGLAVVMMPGWRESKGVRIEIDYFTAGGKPVRYLSWPMLEEKHIAA